MWVSAPAGAEPNVGSSSSASRRAKVDLGDAFVAYLGSGPGALTNQGWWTSNDGPSASLPNPPWRKRSQRAFATCHEIRRGVPRSMMLKMINNKDSTSSMAWKHRQQKSRVHSSGGVEKERKTTARFSCPVFRRGSKRSQDRLARAMIRLSERIEDLEDPSARQLIVNRIGEFFDPDAENAKTKIRSSVVHEAIAARNLDGGVVVDRGDQSTEAEDTEMSDEEGAGDGVKHGIPEASGIDILLAASQECSSR